MKKSTIYREDAIDAVHKYFNDAINNESRGINKDGYDVFTDAKSVNALLYHNKMVSKALSALPSAEVVSREDYHNLLMALNDIDRALREYQAKEEQLLAEAVQGEWIDKGEYAKCSICGAHSGTQFDGVEPIPLKSNFCPNCGARMKGEDDE